MHSRFGSITWTNRSIHLSAVTIASKHSVLATHSSSYLDQMSWYLSNLQIIHPDAMFHPYNHLALHFPHSSTEPHSAIVKLKASRSSVMVSHSTWGQHSQTKIHKQKLQTIMQSPVYENLMSMWPFRKKNTFNFRFLENLHWGFCSSYNLKHFGMGSGLGPEITILINFILPVPLVKRLQKNV